MAKRSDFAQKLLDDLRLRKERLATSTTTSERSNRTNPTIVDAYAYSKRSNRGSKDIRTHEMTGFQNRNTLGRSDGGNRLLTNGEEFSQIVPSESPQKAGDLSMALAFALENGGKLTRIDSSGRNSVISFLHHFDRQPMDYGKREGIDRYQPSSSRLPAVSQIHIKEISKGAQNIYQILRASSNGLNFDGYSIEIGKELFKGAKDLEESLRMLVNLQEGSQHVTSTRSKTQITLLEDDEDVDDKSVKKAEQKQVDRPRFSFDKPSKHYIQEVARTNMKLSVTALTYPSETNFKSGKIALSASNSSSHKRSASYDPDAKPLGTCSSSPHPKEEKGRIPSVIAKLMGLEKLPEHLDLKHKKQKDFVSKQKVEEMVTKKTTNPSVTKGEHNTKDTEDLGSPIVKMLKPGRQVSLIPDRTTLHVRHNLASRDVTSEMVIHNEKYGSIDFEAATQVTGSQESGIRIYKEQHSMTHVFNNTESQNDTQEKESKEGYSKHEKKSIENGETKKRVFKDGPRRGAPQMYRRTEAVSLQEAPKNKETPPQIEQKHRDMVLHRDQQKPQNIHEFPQLALQKSDVQGNNRRSEEREKKGVIQKIHLRKQKRNVPVPTHLSKPLRDSTIVKKQHPQLNQLTTSSRSSREINSALQSKGSPSDKNYEDLSGKSATDMIVTIKDSKKAHSNQNFTPKALVSEVPRRTVPLIDEEKIIRKQATRNAKESKIQKMEIPQKIKEIRTRKNESLHNSLRPLKHEVSMSQEAKHRRVEKLSNTKECDQVQNDKSRKEEVCIAKSESIVAVTQPADAAEQLRKEIRQISGIDIPDEDKRKRPKEPRSPAPTDNCENKISRLANDQQAAQESGDGRKMPSALNGTHEESKDVFYTAKHAQRKISNSEILDSLTDCENHLKHILIKSRLFLNTAEALFRLNIPFGILHGDGRDCDNNESKLILDCGYEVMKRKGRRQELSTHPFTKVSISFIQVKSLDGLVKQLSKDFEKLKYGGLVQDYLPKLLESDLQNNYPDVNCMWDLGWNDMMFAFTEKNDVVRDVEKHVLNRLLNEITEDLLCVKQTQTQTDCKYPGTAGYSIQLLPRGDY